MPPTWELVFFAPNSLFVLFRRLENSHFVPLSILCHNALPSLILASHEPGIIRCALRAMYLKFLFAPISFCSLIFRRNPFVEAAACDLLKCLEILIGLRLRRMARPTCCFTGACFFCQKRLGNLKRAPVILNDLRTSCERFLSATITCFIVFTKRRCMQALFGGKWRKRNCGYLFSFEQNYERISFALIEVLF